MPTPRPSRPDGPLHQPSGAGARDLLDTGGHGRVVGTEGRIGQLLHRVLVDEPLTDAVMADIRSLKKIGQAKLLSFDV